MSEQSGPNFAPGSFALQQSVRLVYTPRALSRGRNRASNQGNEGQPDVHTTQQPARDSEGELAAAAAAPPPPPPPPLLLLLLCCCCAAAVLLLLHDPRCIAEHNPSQQTVSRFVIFGTHAGASNGTAATAAAVVATAAAAEQQQQVKQQGGAKHMYEYIYY